MRARGSALRRRCTAGLPASAGHRFLPWPHPRLARERREANGGAQEAAPYQRSARPSTSLPRTSSAGSGREGLGREVRCVPGHHAPAKGPQTGQQRLPPTPCAPLAGALPLGTWHLAAGRLRRRRCGAFAFVPLLAGHLQGQALVPGRMRAFSAASLLSPQPDVPCAAGPTLPVGHSHPTSNHPPPPPAGAPWQQIGSRPSAGTGKATATSWGQGPGRAPVSLPGPTTIRWTHCRGRWPGPEQGHPWDTQDRGHSWKAVTHRQG